MNWTWVKKSDLYKFGLNFSIITRVLNDVEFELVPCDD